MDGSLGTPARCDAQTWQTRHFCSITSSCLKSPQFGVSAFLHGSPFFYGAFDELIAQHLRFAFLGLTVFMKWLKEDKVNF